MERFMMVPEFALLIDGDLIRGDRVLAILNPADEEVIAQCPLADEAMLEAAVAAAQRAQPAWAARPHAERQGVLTALADVIRENTKDLARLIVQEQGKPFQQALFEVMGAEQHVRFYASLDLQARVVSDTAAHRIEERRKPLGVVAGIVPWNFPFLIAVYKLAPAILAGNAIILKPAPTTPLSMLRFGALIRDIVPAGIVQILTDNNDLGAAIAGHPGIAKVSFTGSTATGKAIMRRGGDTLKRLTLELGGNDAAIVLDDVDLDEVVPKLFMFAFANAGQVCLAIKRLYVHERIYEDVCSRMAKLAESALVGGGFEKGVQIGPLQNRQQFQKILALIEAIRGGDGSIIAGGDRLGEKGYFIRPTIVRDVKETSSLVQEEAFGPIRPILRFSDVDDAIRRANDSIYGLGASVWSADVERATAIAERLYAGTVWVNQHMLVNPDTPLRGAKQSGLGVEYGVEGFHEFTSAQLLSVAKT
jgi:acyl-CoA reductase-like NAD-dependent aldehyde dehydrogenase